MFAKSAVFAVALALTATASAQAGAWTPTDLQRVDRASDRNVVRTSQPVDCVWTYVRGWHRPGLRGAFQACMPGPEWRYERHCWVGPAGAKHCRFFG